MLDRLIQTRILKSNKNILMLGPRQVGKSTLVQSFKPDFYLNLADESFYLSYSKDAALLKRQIATFSKPALIVIDEIQRVPSLLNS